MFSAIHSYGSRIQELPRALTSYDLLKSLALLLMVVDHVGYFFFPEESWFRIVGRLSVPIWFFLIGYAKTRDVPTMMWGGGLLVVMSSLVAGEYLLPLNILFTLALARLWIDRLMAGSLRSYEAFAGMFFLLFFLSVPSVMISEYGTLGMFFTVFGYLRRHKEAMNIHPLAMLLFVVSFSLVYIFASSLMVGQVDSAQALFLTFGVFTIVCVMFFFKAVVFEGLPIVLQKVVYPLKVMGRYSLYIYVGHLFVLRGLALGFGDDRFGFFDFEIMPAALRQFVNALVG